MFGENENKKLKRGSPEKKKKKKKALDVGNKLHIVKHGFLRFC
jgi:hypothetical protein